MEYTAWNMFVSVNNDAAATELLLSNVTYRIHKDFSPSKITLKKHPYILSRYCKDAFDVTIILEFQPWTKLDKIQFDHQLVFKGVGRIKTFHFDVDEIGGLGQKNIKTVRNLK